jgi:hypothetical protein
MSTLTDPLVTLPDPPTIQRRLGELVREERLLRSLLRLSMAAQQERQRRGSRGEEVSPCGR